MSLRTPELWERALDARRAEKVNASAHKVKMSGPQKEPKPAPLPRGGQGHRGDTSRARKHPVAKVGDMLGDRRVVALLPRDHTGNERVAVKCPAGHRREGYVFNFRQQKPCRQCRGKR